MLNEIGISLLNEKLDFILIQKSDMDGMIYEKVLDRIMKNLLDFVETFNLENLLPPV